MAPREFFGSSGSGLVTLSDPPSNVTGMVSLWVDSRGRLTYFKRVPPEHDPAGGPLPPADWSGLFTAAGLDPSAFTPAAPEWAALQYADTRAAWTREIATPIHVTERVEAAAYRGKPVFFKVFHPWDTPSRDQAFQPSAHQQFANITIILLFAVVIVGSIVIVRHNMRQKRGDEVGSVRLGNFLFLVFFAMWALRAHHLAATDEFGNVILALAWAFLVSSFARILYLGLEPFVRRRDPHTLIGWARLIAGKIRDPLVGRDLLIGTTYGVLLGVFESSDNLLLPLFGKLPPAPGTPSMLTLLGVRSVFGFILGDIWSYVLYGLGVFFVLFLLRLVVRKDWIAGLVIVFLGAITNTGGDYFWATFIAAAIIWLSIYLVLRRFGLLALVVGLVVQNMLVLYPTTSRLGRWYASGAIVGLLAIVAIALFALQSALAGQSLFGARILED